MRTIVLTVAMAALGVAACDSAPAGNETASTEGANSVGEAAEPAAANETAAPAAAPAASRDRPALTTEYLVGNWAEENCAEPDVRLAADGSTEGGRWSLRGSQLIRTTTEGEDPPLDIEVVDADHFRVSFAGLPPQTMQRCG